MAGAPPLHPGPRLAVLVTLLALLSQIPTPLLMLGLLSQIPTLSAQCPNTQQCRCEGQILNCRSGSLTEVPVFSDTTSTFTEVTLALNNIASLRANAFRTSPSNAALRTSRLDLSENRVTAIDTAAFSGLESTLQVLIVDVRNMTAFPTAAIAGLTALRELHLKGFSVSALPSGALAPFTQLEVLQLEACGLTLLFAADVAAQTGSLLELHLGYNRLSAVPRAALATLTHVTHVDLSGNRVTLLGADEFAAMAALQWLDLSSNGVGTLHAQAFRGVEDSLQALALSTNGESLDHHDLEALKRLAQLRTLDLSYNALAQLPAGLFAAMTQLQELVLDHNRLALLGEASFTGLGSSLTRLSLRNNVLADIEQFTFQSLSGLRELYLDNNPLVSAFDENTFDGLQSSLQELHLHNTQFRTSDLPSIASLRMLRTLVLEDNEISSIPAHSFAALNSLQSLDLTGNGLSSLTQDALLGPQRSLIDLKLNNNSIEALPSCLFYDFGGAQPYMNLNFNPLRCDCDAYWLQLYIHGMDAFTQLTVNWRCASPAQHAGKLMRNMALSDFCASAPDPVQCTSLTTTPTTAPPTPPPSSTPSAPPATPLSLSVSEVGAHTMTAVWMVQQNEEVVTHFTLECREVESGRVHTQDRELAADARRAELTDLRAATLYSVCVTAWVGEAATRVCTDAATEPGQGETTHGGTPLKVILGAILGALLALVVLGALAAFLILRRRKLKRHPPVGKAMGKAVSNPEIPIAGDAAKRFSKPRNYSVDMSLSRAHSLERGLDGFSAEERDRILALLGRPNNATSTLSMLSAVSQRYVPDPSQFRASQPGPRTSMNGFHNAAIPMQDEMPYEEIPQDMYNYIPFDAINPDSANTPATNPTTPTSPTPHSPATTPPPLPQTQHPPLRTSYV